MMRPVQLADIEIAMRALLAVAPDARPALANRLVGVAKAPHNNDATTLMSAAFRQPLAPRPAQLDRASLQALHDVIAALMHQSA
ncbi:MAG: hypothetical protein AAGF56_07775 [Pseudomonadota bacterium]